MPALTKKGILEISNIYMSQDVTHKKILSKTMTHKEKLDYITTIVRKKKI